MSFGKHFREAMNEAEESVREGIKAAGESLDSAAQAAKEGAIAAGEYAAEAWDSGTEALADLGDSAKRTAIDLKDKAVETYDAVNKHFALSKASDVPAQACVCDNKTLADLDCEQLAGEKAKFVDARTKGALADAVYQSPEEQQLPEGWSAATDEDKEALGLLGPDGEDYTKIADSDFKAEIFKGPDDNYVIAFKGTTFSSMEDWRNNIAQGMGNESRYYSTAMFIGKQTDLLAPGKVEFVGHSLGGGLASAAASQGKGSPASTFNAAGLHDNTLLKTTGGQNSKEVQAYFVKGDILSGLQDKSLGALPRAAGQRYPIAPKDSITLGDVGAGAAGSLVGAGVLAAGSHRGVRLHGMESMRSSIDQRISQIELVREDKGCQ